MSSNNRSFTIGLVVLIGIVALIMGLLIWLGGKAPTTTDTTSSSISSTSSSSTTSTETQTSESDTASSAETISSESTDTSLPENPATSASPYDPSLIP